MIDGVHGADVGQESLGGADVAGGLVPPDVLLPGLERQPETVVTLHILRHSDHAARHVSHVLSPGGEEPGVRPPVAQRNSEPLTGAQSDVHSKLSRGLHDGQSHQVRGADGEGSVRSKNSLA